MKPDTHKMAAALLRHRAEELRALKGEDAFKPFSLKPTAGWALVSNGVIALAADLIDDVARELLSGKAETR